MQKALLLIIHGQHNQKFSKDQLEKHFPDHLHQLTCFNRCVQAVLNIKNFKNHIRIWKKVCHSTDTFGCLQVFHKLYSKKGEFLSACSIPSALSSF